MHEHPEGDAAGGADGSSDPTPLPGVSGASAGTPESPATPGPMDDLTFAVEAARLLADRKCDDVLLLDLRGLSEVTNFVVIGTGTSDRQMKSVADELRDFGKDRGQVTFARDRDPAATWIVVDFVNLIVHLFEPNQRAYYDLESLWGDAPRLRWQREDASGRGSVAASAGD
jgi:ribosome-associated protein